MYTNRYGIKVFHSTAKLVNHVKDGDKEKTMEYETVDQLPYDDVMLPAEDALARYDRDRALHEKYREAEKNVDEEQMTWEDVEAALRQT